MSFYEQQMRANAAQDEQKDKSDYVAELAKHLDVDRNALKAVLSDASASVVEALAVDLSPAGGEPQANAEPLDAYSAGVFGERSGEDAVDMATARERVQTLVANSAGSGGYEERTIDEMSQEEVLDALEDRFATEDDVAAMVSGDGSPTSNEAGSASDDLDEYPDGTVGADVGRDQPTSNAEGEADDDLDDYSDGMIGGDAVDSPIANNEEMLSMTLGELLDHYDSPSQHDDVDIMDQELGGLIAALLQNDGFLNSTSQEDLAGNAATDDLNAEDDDLGDYSDGTIGGDL